MSCDFERDMCNYQQDHSDAFDWIRHDGASRSMDIGPSQDHTYGTSYGKCIAC